jgi:hypothetical protein
VDPPVWVENLRSYDLLFLGLDGEQFTFEGELVEEDCDEEGENIVPVTVPSEGRIGCAVGISVIAPFAVVRYTQMEWADNGSYSHPDIWPSIFDLDGTETDIEAYYEELFLAEGLAALRKLREEIVRVLDMLGVRVLDDREMKTVVPELKPDSVMLEMGADEVVTVEKALFFETFD